MVAVTQCARQPRQAAEPGRRLASPGENTIYLTDWRMCKQKAMVLILNAVACYQSTI